MAIYPMIGVIPAMNTPFLDDGSIDVDGLQKHVEYAVSSGVAGLLAPCVAGEDTFMTMEERDLVLAATREAVNGRVPVFASGNAETVEDCVRITKRLVSGGIDGVMIHPPRYEGPEQFAQFYRDIAALGPKAIMVQDLDVTGPGLPVEVLLNTWGELPQYVSLKVETQMSGPKYRAVIEATGGQLHVCGGWGITQYIEALDRGVHGMVPTGMHEIFCKLDSLYRSGKREQSLKLFLKVQPVACFANQSQDWSVYFYKRLLWRQGYFKTPAIRRNFRPDSVYERLADDYIDYTIQLARDVRAGLYD